MVVLRSSVEMYHTRCSLSFLQTLYWRGLAARSRLVGKARGEPFCSCLPSNLRARFFKT